MLEKKNIYIISDVMDGISDEVKHKPKTAKTGDHYNVTDLLTCRKKLELERAGVPYKFIVTDFSRQGKLGTLLHRAVQMELEKLGWITEMNKNKDATKFTKSIGKYTISMRADGLMYDDDGNVERLLELKFPFWNSTTNKSIPDYYKIQVAAYLNITGAAECKLMVMAKNAFSEHTLTEALSDEDIVWMIEEGKKSPSFDKECSNCFYYDVCDVRKDKKK